MTGILEVESTLTDRYQTTVPEPVRRALGLGKRDKIHYTIRPDGEVVLTRASHHADADPVLDCFLAFLAHDIAHHPQHVRAIDARLAQRIQSLVGDMPDDWQQLLTACAEHTRLRRLAADNVSE